MCSLDSPSLEAIGGSGYSVGKAQREPAKVSCQSLRISVAISLNELDYSVRAPERERRAALCFYFRTPYSVHVLFIPEEESRVR